MAAVTSNAMSRYHDHRLKILGGYNPQPQTTYNRHLQGRASGFAPFYKDHIDESYSDDYDCGELDFDDNESQSASDCFHTTVAIDLSLHYCLILTRVLIDSGAGCHSISRNVVNELNLKIWRCNPTWFTLADGSSVMNNEITYVTIWMGGVGVNIRAFVDDSASELLLLLGEPAWDEFDLIKGTRRNGGKREVKVTVAWNEDGKRGTRYVVPRCPRGERPRMLLVEKTHEMVLSAQEGETQPNHDIRISLGLTRTEWRDRIQHVPYTQHLSYVAQLGRNYRVRPS